MNFFFLLILIILFLAVLLPMILRFWIKQRFTQMQNSHQPQQPQEDYTPSPKQRIDDSEGEYVDYEEIKD